MLTASVESISLWAMLLGGLVAFLSPCVLPMLPVYTLYLVGSEDEKKNAWTSVLLRCLGLAIGFILLFTLLGAVAGLTGGALKDIDPRHIEHRNRRIDDPVRALDGRFSTLAGHPGAESGRNASRRSGPRAFSRRLLFGIVIALSWTPCLTPILANALILAASSATVGTGMLSLAVFALGLSVPMLVFIILYHWLKIRPLRGFGTTSRCCGEIGGVLMIVYGLYLIASGIF